MASIHLILTSLFRNIGHLNFFEDLGRRKLSLRKCKLAFTTGNYSCVSFSETLQRPLWNVSREPGMPHPPFPQQSVLESSQLHQNEGLAESDPDCSTCPTPCHSELNRFSICVFSLRCETEYPAKILPGIEGEKLENLTIDQRCFNKKIW